MFSVMTTFIPLCPKAKALVAEWGEEVLQSGRETQYALLELKWSEKDVTQERECMCINLKKKVCINKTPKHCPLRVSSDSDISVIKNTSHTQIMVSKYQFPLNGREIADSRAGVR